MAVTEGTPVTTAQLQTASEWESLAVTSLGKNEICNMFPASWGDRQTHWPNSIGTHTGSGTDGKQADFSVYKLTNKITLQCFEHIWPPPFGLGVQSNEE